MLEREEKCSVKELSAEIKRKKSPEDNARYSICNHRDQKSKMVNRLLNKTTNDGNKLNDSLFDRFKRWFGLIKRWRHTSIPQVCRGRSFVYTIICHR